MAGPRTAIEAQAPRSRRRNRDVKNPASLQIKEPVAAPAWLDTKAGQDCYHDLQIPLIEAGLLQTLDLPNLALMAQFWSDYIESRDWIRQGKKTVSQYVKAEGSNPIVERMDESLKKYMGLLEKFAGSPIARTKITIRKTPPKSGVEGLFA